MTWIISIMALLLLILYTTGQEYKLDPKYQMVYHGIFWQPTLPNNLFSGRHPSEKHWPKQTFLPHLQILTLPSTNDNFARDENVTQGSQSTVQSITRLLLQNLTSIWEEKSSRKLGPGQKQWKVTAVCKLKLCGESEQKTSVKKEKLVC